MSNSDLNSSTQQNAKHIEALHTFDPWLLWVAFRRNFFWSALFGVILAGTGAFIIQIYFKPEYCATHILEVNREYVVFPGILQAPADFVQNERPLIYNQLVLGPVLSDSKICEAPSLVDPIKRESNLRRNMSVTDGGTSTLMEVSYKDTDPVAAAKVCNAIVRSYLDQRERLDDRRITDLEGYLQPALQFWQNEVQENRKKIVALSKKQAKGVDPFKDSERISADASYLNGLLVELGSLRYEEAVLAAEFALIMKAEKVKKPVEVGSILLQGSSALGAKANELSSVQSRRAVFESNYAAEKERLSTFGGESIELYFAQQKYNQSTSVIEKLSERVASIRTERQKSRTVQTLSEAVTPTNPVESIPWKRMLVVATIAFIAPVGFGLLSFLNTAVWNIWGRSA